MEILIWKKVKQIVDLMRRIDLVGKRKDKLVVMSFLEKRGKHLYWKALCDCGKENKISSTNFLQKETASCGCTRNKKASDRWKGQKRKNTLPEGEGSLSCLINQYKQGAKLKNVPFSLSRDEFRQLTKSNCYYCGRKPENIIKGKRSNGEYVYNGIDRINSDLGYSYSNCVTCCVKCNTSKMDYSFSEFINWAEKLANNLLKMGDIQLDEEVYLKLEKL